MKRITKKEKREHIEAIQEMLQKNPEIGEKVEQMRQARSRTEGREVSFWEMFFEIATVGAEDFLKELRKVQ